MRCITQKSQSLVGPLAQLSHVQQLPNLKLFRVCLSQEFQQSRVETLENLEKLLDRCFITPICSISTCLALIQDHLCFLPSPGVSWDSDSGCIPTKLIISLSLIGYTTTRLSSANHIEAELREAKTCRVSGSCSATSLGMRNRKAAFPELKSFESLPLMNRRVHD